MPPTLYNEDTIEDLRADMGPLEYIHSRRWRVKVLPPYLPDKADAVGIIKRGVAADLGISPKCNSNDRNDIYYIFRKKGSSKKRRSSKKR